MSNLDELHSLINAIYGYGGVESDSRSILDGMYCSSCGGHRRMDVRSLTHNSIDLVSALNTPMDEIVGNYAPVLLTFLCVQCDARYTSLIYPNQSEQGVGLAVFPEKNGSYATPHTPDSVAYFLDQVYRCTSVGAVPAALAMYRVALDQIMVLEGFDQRMLGNKIGALEGKIKDGTAPDWAGKVDVDFIRVLKDIADSTLHVDDGDVSKLMSLDTKLLAEAKVSVQHLLEIIYEEPARHRERLANLRRAAEELNT